MSKLRIAVIGSATGEKRSTPVLIRGVAGAELGCIVDPVEAAATAVAADCKVPASRIMPAARPIDAAIIRQRRPAFHPRCCADAFGWSRVPVSYREADYS